MIDYEKDELMSSTEIARNFNSVLDSLRSREKDKIVVMRNNGIEAVVVSVEEYEKMQETTELFEHAQIHKAVKNRENTPLEDYVGLDRLLADHGLTEDDL